MDKCNLWSNLLGKNFFVFGQNTKIESVIIFIAQNWGFEQVLGGMLGTCIFLHLKDALSGDT